MDLRNQQGQSNSLRDKVRRMAEEKQHKGGSYLSLPQKMNFWKVKEEATIDIMPYEVTVDNHKWVKKGDLWFERSYMIHKNVGVEKKWYVCPQSVGKRCPICEHQADLRKQGGDEELIKSLTPQKKQLFNIVDVEEEIKGVQLWDFPYRNFGEKLEEEIRKQNPKFADFFLLDRGYSLKIRFTPKTFLRHNFFDTSRIDFIERSPYDDAMLSRSVDLDRAIVVLSYDELKGIFLGVVDEDLSPMPMTVDETPVRANLPLRSMTDPTSEQAAPIRRRIPSAVVDATYAEIGEQPKAVSPNPCPFGFQYGIDNEKKTECTTCGDEWEGCKKLKDEMERANRRKIL